MARNHTVRLLLVNASDNDSERLVSLFRGAGRVARAHRVASAEALAEALAQEWDLLVADDQHPQLGLEQALARLAAHPGAPPVIALRGGDPAPLFAAGARDVLAPGEDPRLLHAALREIETAALRRELARLRDQLDEAERRSALLLGEADQAVAYLADGMLISVNAAFAAHFGHADPADLDATPVIDLIAPDSQEAFKALLKAGDGARQDCTALRADGTPFAATLVARGARYDGEPCTQLLVEERGAAPAGADARQQVLERLAAQRGGSLLLLGIDRAGELRGQLGYEGWEALLAALGALIEARALVGATALRLGDEFALLAPDTAPAAALAWAEALCAAAAETIVEREGQSRQFTISAGVAAVEDSPAAGLLDRALAACEQARAEGGNSARRQASARVEPAGSPGALTEALEENRFSLLFQPLVALRDAGGDHYETLLCWQGEGGEPEPADAFLAALEADPAHARLDRWMLVEATKRLAAARADGADIRLLVNLTVNGLLDPALPDWLGVALRAAGLPATALLLQLREADVLNYLRPAAALAEAMARLGCPLSIAGFGQAPEPARTLASVPATLVRLDDGHTRALQTGGDPQPLRQLVAAATAQGARVIVPGVENAVVLAALWQVGADFIQGPYLQAPSPALDYAFNDMA